MTTGSRIRALRESRGMTQRQLAERAGCTDAAIRNYEAGRRALKGSALDAIAGALGVAPEALMPVQAESVRDALELLFRIEEEFGLRPVGGGRLAVAPGAAYGAARRLSSPPPSRPGNPRWMRSTAER